MAASLPAPARLRPLQVIQEGIEILLREPGAMIGLALVPSFAAAALVLLAARLPAPDPWPDILVTVVQLAGVCAATVVVTRAVLALADGRLLSFGEAFGTIGAAAFRAFGASFVLGLAITVGLLLLVLPGVLMAAAWIVAVPAAIMEDLGPIGAARRSSQLSRGNRWRAILLILLTQLFATLFTLAVGLLLLVPLAAAAWLGLLGPGESFPRIQSLAEALGYALSALCHGTFGALAWRRLTEIRQGSTPGGREVAGTASA
ncbi:MAG TPA: hypothetical protein VHL31_20315 [Geminicoccus sp.]|uniref:hypothetical protein n=1 Tax=Geminicoccus sp. TaxID=2024832 RepID=UPI002E3182DE|nr:hypothetical protein [Geminicoccus sp.]HEX2528625.1 hypothetical protein [Geminicoccus sp.]